MKYDTVMGDTTSYTDHACTLAVGGWEIPAALTLPARTTETLPSAVLLVPGSLFSDVNGDYPAWNSFPHVYGHLAHQIAACGHAVYRFAKLGPGTGSVAVDAALAPTVRNWDGRLVIANAALDAMTRELATRGLRAGKMIAAGHSEGAVVVSRLAVSDRAAELDGVVLLAGPSVGILGIMREQVGFMTPPDQLEDARRRLDAAIELVRRGEPIPPEVASSAPTGAGALASMPEEGRRYMRECDASDPLALARLMPQPTLVVQGANDASVPVHHGQALRDALRARPGGAGRTDYLCIPDLTHMFKILPPGVGGMEAFGFPGETDQRVAAAIDRWIRAMNVDA